MRGFGSPRGAAFLVASSLAMGTLLIQPAAAASSPTASAASCGSVLLAGSAWLGGLGVDVKSNGADQGTGTSCGGSAVNSVNGVKTGYEWQCTELVNRLYVTRGWIAATWPGNGGRSSPTARDSMYDEAPASLSKQPNGSISYLAPGDVVSVNVYDGSSFVPDGHVLVVNTVSGGNIDLVSQNGATVTTSATLSDGNLTIPNSGSWTYPVIGVIHAPGSAMGVIDKDGAFYRVDGGAWSQLVSAADKPTAISVSGNAMGVIDKDGAFYRVDGGAWSQLVSAADKPIAIAVG